MKREPKNPRSWEDTNAHLVKTHGGFRNLIKQRIEKLNCDKQDRMRFKALMGRAPMEGPLRLSDMYANFQFAEFVAGQVRNLRMIGDTLDFYHLTLLADEGNMSDRAPKFPLRTLTGKADKALRSAGLDGIFRIEVQALINWPRKGNGRTLLGHVHAVVWIKRDAPGNSVADIREALMPQKPGKVGSWTSELGANPVVIVPITRAMGCPSYWVAYDLKMPHDAKNLFEKKGKPGESGAYNAKFEPTIKGYRPELAMRLCELFSQLPLYVTTGGVGAGASFLRRAKSQMALWAKQRQQRWIEEGKAVVPPFDERKFWERTHARRRKEYEPSFIDGPTIQERIARRISKQ